VQPACGAAVAEEAVWAKIGRLASRRQWRMRADRQKVGNRWDESKRTATLKITLAFTLLIPRLLLLLLLVLAEK
jgi:hypothetical protein